MWSSVLSLAVLSSIWGCVHLIAVSVPIRSANVTAGENLNLPCFFVTSQPTTNLNIQWSFLSPSRTIQTIYYYQGGNYQVSENYRGRVIVPSSPNTMMNASITIRDVTPADAGSYDCEVHNFPDAQGNTQGTIQVTVFEKPSMPFCGIHGTVESGHLVTLTCHSEHGSPTLEYTWHKLDQGQALSTSATTNVETGVLQFGNLSQFEFGIYQCNASNAVGFAVCTIELNEERGDGVIAGAVVGSLLLSCLIILFVWCIIHSLRKKHKERIENQSKSRNGGSGSYADSPPEESKSRAEVSKQEEEPIA